MYWLQLMDKYAANWSVLIIAIIECILIAWLYGSERFLNDIQSMIGRHSRGWVLFWSWMWRLVTPATLMVSDPNLNHVNSHISTLIPLVQLP